MSEAVGHDTTSTEGTPSAEPGATPTPAATAAPAAPAAGTPPVADPKPAESAPETYEFTAPEGVVLDKDSTAKFVEVARELKLSKEAAQKVVDIAVAREQAARDAHAATVAGWADTVRADKEIGGDKLAATLAAASKAVGLAGEEFKTFLNETGYGNHPSMVRAMAMFGKALSEDRFVTGTGQGAQADVAKRMFPTMTN
jgi:hypothetical protein